MKIRDLLDKFDLLLKLSDAILDFEVEGDYESYSIKKFENDVFYRFEDDLHELLLCETAEEMVWYVVSPAPGMPGIGGGYDKDGIQITMT
ncbi:MAG: hypothetical protein IJF83_13745 [Methanobrevibacter sp.]|nr:hypothetical protein [Methanobrevibacter sp.]